MAFALLIGQGCAHVHFGDEGREDKDKLPKANRLKGLLDESPREDSQGEVTIKVRFAGVTYREDVAFNVEIGTHAVKVGEYALEEMSTLTNNLGAKVPANKWEITFMSADGISLWGTLYFPSRDASGKPLIGEGVRNLILIIEDLAGIPERVFQWGLPRKHGKWGERTIDKILWVD